MRRIYLIKILAAICVVFSAAIVILAQNSANTPIKSREVSDIDGIPVLIKHLPDWENARNRATYILNQNDLRNALGERPVFNLIDFESGAEAVTVAYPEGQLLLVEFMTPQSSIDADQKIKQLLEETNQTQSIVYRRTGNYNIFVFDTNDAVAANTLVDEIKYEKNVQWLGEDPFLLKRAERAIVTGLSELFIATTLTIIGGLCLSIVAGIIVGIIFFRFRDQKRAGMEAFSDAGGMTRLNLDDLTPKTSPDRLLND